MMQGMGQEVQVFRNDQITLDCIEKLCPCGMVISPGPGSPDKAGISVEAVRHFGGRVSFWASALVIRLLQPLTVDEW